jgi:pimeloyl-ACP methyl ester carboxylesterase
MELVRWPGLGHTPHREQPDLVLDEIAAFLHRLGA